MQMAAVFAELEHGMIRGRVTAGLNRAEGPGVTLGRPRVAGGVEAVIRRRLAEGHGMVLIAKALGLGVSTVQRVRKKHEATRRA